MLLSHGSVHSRSWKCCKYSLNCDVGLRTLKQVQSNTTNIEKCIEKISKTKLISTKPTMTEADMLDIQVSPILIKKNQKLMHTNKNYITFCSRGKNCLPLDGMVWNILQHIILMMI